MPPRWPEVGATRNQFTTIEYRRIISPTMVNLLRFSFTRTRETDVQQSPNQTPALNFFPERGQNGGVNITGFSSIGTSIYAPLLEVQNKFPVSDDFIWTKGAHNLRFGGLVQPRPEQLPATGMVGRLLYVSQPDRFSAGLPESIPGAGAGPNGLLS